MLKIGWFSTARGPTSRRLLQVVQENIQQQTINGQIIFAFTNRNPGEYKETDQFFELTRSYNIPTVYFSLKEFESAPQNQGISPDQIRIRYDRIIIEKLRRFSPDICVLAGYMLIVGNEMCRKYSMINLHPALPDGPKGTWQQVIWQLIENRVEQSGVMMHLVTPDLDRGPVITYCSYPITGEPFDEHWLKIKNKTGTEIQHQEGENNLLFQIIRKHGVARELPLIVATLKAFGNSEFSINQGELLDKQGNRITGYDLTREVDALARESLNSRTA